ncbi:MAG: heme exporter protein CcmB [Firmicutes bacterium]|nr:heme exporter protein CcmB [Bacillota bacterium]
MANYLRYVLAIAGKDLRAELRSKEMFSAMTIFALLVAVVFSFAFDANAATLQEVFPGVIWVAFFFAGTLGLNRSFVNERQNSAIHGLMLAPADRSVIYFGKVLGNMAVITITEAIGLPVFLVLFDVSAGPRPALLVLSIVLATLGFIAIGTFLSALAANTRTGEILLPIILFPVAVPVVLGAVQTTGAVLLTEGVDLPRFYQWLRVLAVYDVVFLVVPFLLFDYVLEV